MIPVRQLISFSSGPSYGARCNLFPYPLAFPHVVFGEIHYFAHMDIPFTARMVRDTQNNASLHNAKQELMSLRAEGFLSDVESNDDDGATGRAVARARGR